MSIIKIEVLGHTSTGKSSLVSRLIGFQSLNNDDAESVCTIKSTYCPMKFDGREPFISSTSGIEIPVKFVNIHVLGKDRAIGNDRVEAGIYLDDIRNSILTV